MISSFDPKCVAESLQTVGLKRLPAVRFVSLSPLMAYFCPPSRKKTVSHSMKISTKQKEFIRFCLVGGGATALHYGIYLLLNRVMNTTIAFSTGYLISFFANFVLSNYFTFKTRPSAGKGVGFTISHIVNYLLQVGFLNLFIYLGVPKNWAPLPVYAITVPINFILVRTALKSSRL